MKIALDHIHLRCHDVETTVLYYQRVFGAEVERKLTVMGMPIVRIKVGDISLALSPKQNDETVNNNAYQSKWGVYQIGLKIHNMASIIEKLESNGGVFTRKNIEVASGVKASFMDAPDGVEIELLEIN